jgi:glycosyltransferase involved in cell wall biosynthesis
MIPESKITVIHSAVDEKLKEPVTENKIKEVAQKYGLPKDYLLHVGTLEPRKNLEFLIDVFHEALKDERNQDLHLVVTGKKGWYYEGLFAKVKKLKLGKKVIFTGYLDEDDKVALYKGAKIFTFPSLYEGFGLPPLEAMAAGVPVISSNTSSMPEVIGEAGILLSPRDKEGWVREITHLNNDAALHRELTAKNKAQVEKFSWHKTAEKTIKVYEEAMAEYLTRKKA